MHDLKTRRFSIHNFLIISLIAATLLTTAILLKDTLGLYAANSLASIVVFTQGLFALHLIWQFEIGGRKGIIPFAWCCFAVQHLAFGFGGLIVSIFDQDYSYANSTGLFSWNEVVLPFLLVHAVSMNVAVIGTSLATRSGSRFLSKKAQTGPLQVRSWEEDRSICYASLLLHGLVWIVLLNLKLPPLFSYPVSILAFSMNATFIFWALSWRRSPRKWVFIVYTICFVVVEMIIGGRGSYMYPLILFGIGLLIAPDGRKLDLRFVGRCIPAILLLSWIFVKTEDVRSSFVRGTPADSADAIARLDSFAAPSDSNADSHASEDGNGTKINGLFRIGSRLFELSAADIISRTPNEISFWGWSTEDSTVLWTSLLPLNMNPDSAYYSSDTAGVLFLRSYGWTQVDPSAGNSMPATIVGDSWRRFGWPGVVIISLVWAWVLANATMVLRLAYRNVPVMVFSSALLANYAFQYTSDIIYLGASVPRRLLTVGAYAAIVWGLAKVFDFREGRLQATSPSGVFVLSSQELDIQKHV
jgi:hypothetical protein